MKMKNFRGSWLALIGLSVLGTFRTFADLAGAESISALGAMTQVSPAMKVFTAHNGFETFANEFVITINRVDGSHEKIRLNPETYKKLKGPYNRRNAYGATIAYAPLLTTNPQTRQMFEEVTNYAICSPGKLIHEVAGLQPSRLKNVRIEILPFNSYTPSDLPLFLEISCELK